LSLSLGGGPLLWSLSCFGGTAVDKGKVIVLPANRHYGADAPTFLSWDRLVTSWISETLAYMTAAARPFAKRLNLNPVDHLSSHQPARIDSFSPDTAVSVTHSLCVSYRRYKSDLCH